MSKINLVLPGMDDTASSEVKSGAAVMPPPELPPSKLLQAQQEAAQLQLATQQATEAAMQKTAALSDEERQQVEQFAAKINLNDVAVVSGYGLNVQQKLEKFTSSALQGVSGYDIGAVGKLLSELCVSIKTFNDNMTTETGNPILNHFRAAKNRVLRDIEEIRVEFDCVLETIERIKKALLGQTKILEVDITTLDQMYQATLDYYKEMSMYIDAGELRITEVRAGELMELNRKAAASGSQFDAEAYASLAKNCDSFELQLQDLEMTRAAALQSGVQFRILRETDVDLSRKIRSAINNTIPIWQSQITAALLAQHTETAADIQRDVTDLTSKMFEEVSKQLHRAAVKGATEAGRAVIDYESVVRGNEETISMIQDLQALSLQQADQRLTAKQAVRQSSERMRQVLLNAGQRQTA